MPRHSENPLLQLNADMAEVCDALRNEWRFGTTSKYLPRPGNVAAQGSSADWHWRDETKYFLAVERARSWDRNNMVVGQGVDRLCDNVLGEEGPTINPDTGNADLNVELKQRFTEWANNPALCDHDGTADFWEMSWLAFRHCIVDGDFFGNPLSDGRLQCLENHRCRTPNRNKQSTTVAGIVRDDKGRKKQYLFTKFDPVSATAWALKSTEVDTIAAFDEAGNPNVFHLLLPRRKSQLRGVSKFAPACDPIGMHDDLQFAKMVQAKVASCFAIIEELSADAELPAPPKRGSAADTDQLGARTTETRVDGTDEIAERLGPGMIIRGRKGSKYSGFSPGIPNAEFFNHATMILTFVAINLDLPLAVLLLDPSNTNFSGWRGAIDQARVTYRRLQKLLVARWFDPVYRWKLRQFIAADTTLAAQAQQLGPRFFQHKWQAPGWKYIQPLQDAQADLLELSGSLTSQRRRCAVRNMDWGELSTEIVDDNATLIIKAHEKAQTLNKTLGLSLTWKDLVTIYLPSGLTLNTSTGPAQPQAGAA